MTKEKFVSKEEMITLCCVYTRGRVCDGRRGGVGGGGGLLESSAGNDRGLINFREFPNCFSVSSSSSSSEHRPPAACACTHVSVGRTTTSAIMSVIKQKTTTTTTTTTTPACRCTSPPANERVSFRSLRRRLGVRKRFVLVSGRAIITQFWFHTFDFTRMVSWTVWCNATRCFKYPLFPPPPPVFCWPELYPFQCLPAHDFERMELSTLLQI